MPTSSFYNLCVYRAASEFPVGVWDTLRANAGAANLILPHAEKTLKDEISGHTRGNQLWITCTSSSSHDIEFILSCTEGLLGSYPIFIFTPVPFRELNTDQFGHPIRLLARELHNLPDIAPTRIFSVFSVEPITRIFAEEWSRITKINYIAEPYYKAKLTHCINETLVTRPLSMHADLIFELRLATPGDTEAVAELCYDFAKTSEPFTLTRVSARREAESMIQKQQVWVHDVQRVGGGPVEIASIVATTRQTETACAISKVYTNEKWRGLKCAERLVRRVTKEHLRGQCKVVVLYVADDNPAAARVYEKVGFAGLSKDSPPVEGVDTWLELGFDRSKVTLGHW